MIKAVGFDWGGVMYGQLGKKYDKQVSEFLNVPLDEYKKVYYSMNSLVNEGTLTRFEFDKKFLEKINRSEELNNLIDFREKYYLTKTINQNMLDLVDTLKGKGFTVGLLTNNTKEARKRFEGEGVLGHFDSVIISAEVGISKPDPAIFQLFSNQLGVNVSELIFIDDSENSLRTSQEIGYTPLLFENYEKLVGDLKSLKII